MEGHHLFFAKQNGSLSDEQHLAEMISLMGPPPPEFLKRSEKCQMFWDSDGISLPLKLLLCYALTLVHR